MKEVITNVKTSRRAPNVSQIMIPGEPEFMTEEARRMTGIFVEDPTWDAISEIAKGLGVAIPEPMRA
jgi:LDH2 family malate/lactate/ureidoglycolate dehydrogenase